MGEDGHLEARVEVHAMGPHLPVEADEKRRFIICASRHITERRQWSQPCFRAERSRGYSKCCNVRETSEKTPIWEGHCWWELGGRQGIWSSVRC